MYSDYKQKEIDRIKKDYEDNLLQCYILLENNNFQSSKEASTLYSQISGLPPHKAFIELKEKYKQFIQNQTKP